MVVDLASMAQFHQDALVLHELIEVPMKRRWLGWHEMIQLHPNLQNISSYGCLNHHLEEMDIQDASSGMILVAS